MNRSLRAMLEANAFKGSFTDPVESSRINPNALYPVIWPETGRLSILAGTYGIWAGVIKLEQFCPSMFAAQLHLDIPRREAPLCLHKICKEGLT